MMDTVVIVIEFLCYHYFPPCNGNHFTPLCEQSCLHYFTVDHICTDHLRDILQMIDIDNASLNYDICSQLFSYNASTANRDCIDLKAIPNANDSVECVPVPTNSTCRTNYNFSSYAPEVARRHATLVSDLELFNTDIVNEKNPFCIDVIKWYTCSFKYPACEDFKLLPLCQSDCFIVEGSYMETCLDIFVEVFNQLEQQISLENI